MVAAWHTLVVMIGGMLCFFVHIDGLAQEIASLKKEVDQGQRRFYVLETNVKGVIFIRFTDSRMQPVPFVTRSALVLLSPITLRQTLTIALSSPHGDMLSRHTG